MFRAALVAGCGLLAAVAVARGEELPVRDPMRPFAAGPAAGGGAGPAAQGPRFELTAVVLGEGRRVAVVNGRPLLVGDTVAGAKIIAIEPNAVRVDDAGRELVVPLGRPVTSRSATVQGEKVP